MKPDPLVSSLRQALTGAVRKAKLVKVRRTTGNGSGSGFFGFGVSGIPVSSSTKLTAASHTDAELTSEQADTDEIEYRVILPDSDRSKPVSRKARKAKKKKRKTKKASKRKNMK